MNDIFKSQIFFDDNLTILKKIRNETIDLIYIDPPLILGKKAISYTNSNHEI